MSQLVPYAGYDPQEMTPDQRSERSRKAIATRKKIARRMFRNGKDTMQIADWMRINESTAHRWITEERNREYAEKQP